VKAGVKDGAPAAEAEHSLVLAVVDRAVCIGGDEPPAPHPLLEAELHGVGVNVGGAAHCRRGERGACLGSGGLCSKCVREG
jgi:hypothetical protein